MSMIDVNSDKLSQRFVAFPNLVSAQFIPLYFTTWEETRQSAELFLRNQGDERNAGDLRSQQIVRLFAGYFPSEPDREWLRLFIQAVDDERGKFFVAYWRNQQQQRAAARAAVDSLWRTTYRQRFARFLNNSGSDRGTIILSLPLNGEGRTLDVGQRTRLVAVNFPESSADAREALFTLAHEVSSSVTSIAIDDNTSPAEKRNGTGRPVRECRARPWRGDAAAADRARARRWVCALLPPLGTRAVHERRRDGSARLGIPSAGCDSCRDPAADRGSAGWDLTQCLRTFLTSRHPAAR
jgi:hypothetical protein